MKDTVAFTLFNGKITVEWYAICVTGGMVLALLLLIYLMSRRKDEYLGADDALEVFLFAVPFAVLFARLGYSIPRLDLPLTSWEEFFAIFDMTHGGLTIVVGLVGGALGIFLYSLIRKKSLFRIFDLLIPCLLLGQVVGRWGNFVNQELYGLPITNPAFQFFPFAVYIEETGQYHCANFFYESFANFIALIVVLFVMHKYKNKLKVGTISVGYVVWYGLLRGTLEFIKIDQMMWGNIRAIQLICYIAACIGIVVMILLQKGIIKLETEKMKERHFITKAVTNESMANNCKYEVKNEIIVTDENLKRSDTDSEDMNE